MNEYITEEPAYICESDEILLLRKVHSHSSLGLQKGHWNSGFTLLIQTLYITYGDTLYSNLVKNADKYGESETFSKNMKEVIRTNQWGKSTSYTALNALKKILSSTDINEGFITKITIYQDKKVSKYSPEFCLPSNYNKYER